MRRAAQLCGESTQRVAGSEWRCSGRRGSRHQLVVVAAAVLLSIALLQAGAQAADDESARCTSAQPPHPPRPPPSPPLTRPPSPVQLRKATGVVIQPTPTLKAANESRYNGSLSSDAQRRPLVQGLYEVLAQESNVVAVHLAHVPRTDTFLYMERPSVKRSNALYGFQIAGTFDLVTRNWTRVNSVDGLFCCGHTIDSEGRVIVTGGHKQSTSWPDGMRSVRIFDIVNNHNTLVNETWMSWKRWYPTPTLLPDGQIMIMGGRPAVGGSGPGVQEYELYNPLTGARQYPLPCRMVEDSFFNHMKKMYYPFNFVLPTGDVMVFGERQVRIMVAQTGVFRTNGSGVANFFPRMPGPLSQFPYTATGVYGPLTFANNYSSVDLMVFGGAVQSAVDDQSTIAGRTVRRLKVSWKRLADGRYDYSYGEWSEEDLGMPRVMGDGTLLPNGDVLLLNGAQVGVAGDSGTSGGSGGRANYPNFWAQLYQPDKPQNKRVSTLAGSSIARMYHGVAVLTTNGTILVSGCDRCFRLSSDVPSYVSPTGREEYRNEIFYPPYWFDTPNKPRILTVNGKAPGSNGTTLRTSTTLGYAQTFTLTWGNATGGSSSVPPVTQVSLVAPSSTTHSFNANQRVVFLEILAIDYTKRQLTARTPPHPYIAPPQWYMVFALNGKTYSQAAWVRLVDQTGAGKVIPADYSYDRRK